MKRESTRQLRPLIFGTVLGTLTAIVTTVGCASKPKPTVVLSAQPVSMSVRPQAPKSVAFTSDGVPTKAVEKPASAEKAPQSKFIGYKSRDYGVSFQYPWQYTRLGAKAVAGDYSLQPQSDGLNSQLTLVRIDIPKGFYPGTDFDSGYFALSVDPDLNKDQCEAVLKPAKGQPQVVNINGVEYRWMESSSGSHGESAKIRDYAGFANDTCYELETGVKTKNDGLSREIDPDQVLRRLDPILISVKIDSAYQAPAKQQMQSAKENPPSESGK